MSIAADTEVGITAEGGAVSWAQIQDAVREMREYVSLKLTTGACATRLLYELAGHWCGMPQSFGGNPVLVHVHAVLDQIGVMERAKHALAAKTKAATPFKSGSLRGLWHKHWFQASFMVDNLANEMKKNGTFLIVQRLSERYGCDGWDGRTIDKEMVGLLAHASAFDALEYRAGIISKGAASRLTGEWIVFAKLGPRNIYLTLGGHDETNEAILERCLPAVREFPELGQIEPFNSARRTAD